ncbi:group II truncated hemoglobin [Salinarimonas ramus]|uniref:Globin n=1 Tax=Salinarimonas ramus TaxID=690164 RepID=A0A917V2L3_9HYPH|nr:group II truncated hemoglobin [Salinarimonas ramus]GGK29401.1 globin [Salinarimonas ramus]
MTAPAPQPHVKTLYDAIGGAPVVERLAARFYALMDTLPEARACREIHPETLEQSEEMLRLYLTGWLGGPPVYVERRGPPMLRRRHLHAPIGTAEIEGWLACFERAWTQSVADRALDEVLLPKVRALAWHMRNRDG